MEEEAETHNRKLGFPLPFVQATGSSHRRCMTNTIRVAILTAQNTSSDASHHRGLAHTFMW